MQQKKVGGSPNYENLSKPYLEKMKFLDNFIQPRKTYRQVGLFGPNTNLMHHMFDGNESSRSNSSLKLTNGHQRNDVEDVFSQLYQMNQYSHNPAVSIKQEENGDQPSALENGQRTDAMAANILSSSSSVVSQESPMTGLNSTQSDADEGPQSKRRRSNSSIIERNGNHNKDASSDNDDGENSDNETSARESPSIPPEFLYPFIQHQQQQQHQSLSNSSRARKPASEQEPSASAFSTQNHLIQTLFQQSMASRSIRSSEQLLGELVTSELLKMTKDRKKIAQRKILEILFFGDD